MAIEEKTNPNLVKLIEYLKTQAREQEAPIWRDVAERLEKPSKNWAEVNLSRIQRHVNEGETIVVPGKVLGAGFLNKEVTVGTFKASKGAIEGIENAGGDLLKLHKLVEQNPSGEGIRVFG